ncbi:MAG: OmpA family protein [Clostridium sp.]|nr:OmpA family protein [Clostridium sp.]
MGGKTIKWGNLIIFLLIISAAIAAIYFKFLETDTKEMPGKSANRDKNNKDVPFLEPDDEGILFSSEDSFIMGLDSWIGGTPILIALDRGYNKDYLLDLKTKYIHADSERMRELAEGNIHATEISLPSFMRFQELYPNKGIIVGITDFSRGADGILAKTQVRDLNDIEGKRVSYVKNGTGKFILNKFLRLVGLRYQDIEPIERESMEEVINDLRLDIADVIVSWSPDMNLAVNEINELKPDSVKILITTKEVPDLIPTMLVVNREYAREHPDKVEDFLKTWFVSTKYILERTDKAYERLTQLMGDAQEYGEITVPDVAKSLEDVRLMSLNDNLSYFGFVNGDSRIASIIDDTIETWKRYGDMDFNFTLPGEITGINYIAGMGDDKELLVGVLNTNSLEDTEVEKEFEKQDGESIERNTEKIAKVDIPPVYYDTGKATVMPESLSVLNEVLSVLSQFPEYYLIVDAHTDSVGSVEMNLTLSQNRAIEVKKYLANHGIDENRIVARGWGKSKLLVEEDVTEEDKARNRRTEFILTRETNQ